MIVRDDLPPTPDWSPEPRCDCPEARIDHFTSAWMKPGAECPAHVSQPLTWDGDNG